MSTTTLFVYGTLRPDFPNPLARRLKAQAKLLGTGWAPGTLYDFGWYPGAIFKADAKSRVIGEVFELKNADRLLAELDHYEGTAEPLNPFRRTQIIVHLDRGRTVEAWTYAMIDPPKQRRPIASGDYVLHMKTALPRKLRS